MNLGNKRILSLRIAYIAGIFSLIVGVVMVLNYWQLATTDPLESKTLEVLFEQLQEDTRNEELKNEIRNLDLLARDAYFSSQWQIRSGAYLLIAGIVITVVALRFYFASKAEVLPPGTAVASLDVELLITRRWVLYSIGVIFGLALIASFLSVNYLSGEYLLTETAATADDIPVQEITPRQTDVQTVTAPSGEEAIEPGDAPESAGQKVTPDDETAQAEEVPAESRPADDVTSVPPAPDIAATRNNYPAFRGPFGIGVTKHTNIPVEWDGQSGENIRWKTAVPLHGYSSPVIWGERLFVTGADETNESLYCYNTGTGTLLWEHKVVVPRSAVSIRPTEDTGYAAPSAATDGRFVAVIYATGDVACTDMSGNEVWAKNIGVPENHYGHSSSLLIWKNLLLIQFDTNDSGKVLALDLPTGNLVWEKTRTAEISWASPILANVNGRYQLILSSSPIVAGYDPETGDELWKIDCLSGEVGPSPAYSNGIVFTTNEYAILTAFTPGNPPTVLWEDNEYLSEVSSPVAVDDLLFTGTSYGVVACYRAATGEKLWEYECDRGFYASPVVADGKIFFIDRGGKMYIFAASESLEFINDPELGEGVFATPAFMDGRIFIRAYENLFCIGN